MSLMIKHVFFFILLFLPLSLKAKGMESEEKSKKNEMEFALKNLLREHCPKNCELINLSLTLSKETNYTEQTLGFEDIAGPPPDVRYVVSEAKATIQIDRRTPQEDKEELTTLLESHLGAKAKKFNIEWVPLILPEVEASHLSLEALKEHLKQKITEQLDQIIQKYCPETCTVAHVGIQGREALPEEIKTPKHLKLYTDKENDHQALVVEGVSVDVTFDQSMPTALKDQILQLMKNATKSYDPVNYKVDAFLFPESFEKRTEKEKADPYGLDRLKQTLTLFRDLAGTKEIITKTTNSSSESKSSTDSKENTSSSDTKESSKGQDETTGRWVLYLMAFISLFGLIGFIFVRFSQAKRDTQILTGEFQKSGGGSPDHQNRTKDKKSGLSNILSSSFGFSGSSESLQDLAKKRFERDQLKNDLIQTFFAEPKAAKEAFSLTLIGKGDLLEMAKYIHIFGKIVIFELIHDPSLQTSLDSLSQFYQESDFDLSIDEEIILCRKLKRQITAQEIRTLTHPEQDQFSFLDTLSPQNLKDLLVEESPMVQAVIFSELKAEKRAQVFGLWPDNLKNSLLRELVSTAKISKEYLQNLAFTLRDKIDKNPNFKAISKEATTVALNLLEMLDFSEQKNLLQRLTQERPQEARLIKSKLVTIETLAHMPDKLILQWIMDLSHEDILAFLSWCPKTVSSVIIGKAPMELSRSWSEELSYYEKKDPARYEEIEKDILQKIKTESKKGAVDLVAINDMIFASYNL